MRTIDLSDVHGICILTDSLTALKEIERGPLSVKDPLCEEIWHYLLTLSNFGFRITIAFLHAHCGTVENEDADRLAHTLVPVQEEAYPHRQQDVKIYLTQLLREQWLPTLPTDTHRYMLVGNTSTKRTEICPITQDYITRRHQVLLTRIRTGSCTTHGTFYHLSRNTPNRCRYCHPQMNTPINDAAPPECPRIQSRKRTKLHPQESSAGQFNCTHPGCQRTFPSAKSRARHLPVHNEPARKTEPETPPPKEPGTDTILHALFCPHLANLREKHDVDNLLEQYQQQYFYSLPCLRFAANSYAAEQTRDKET